MLMEMKKEPIVEIHTTDNRGFTPEEVQSAMVFFWVFVNELFQILPLYLMDRLKETNKQ